jgi:acyl carrier protein phosphodiesterase
MEDITHCSQENHSHPQENNGAPQRTLDDIVSECREYIMKRNASARERVPDVGKPMYLISKAWLKRYKEYILMADVKRNNKPHIPENHVHPGAITND